MDVRQTLDPPVVRVSNLRVDFRSRAGTFTAVEDLSFDVSPGETLEEAATREGLEEVGATLSKHRYLFCQPWPFPSQLMVGMISQAADRTVQVDPKELEDAKWFPRAEVEAVFDKTGDAFLRPPKTTIAHQLLKAWLSGQ